MIVKVVKNIKFTWLIFSLLVFIGLIKLASWQWQRAEQKQQRLANIEQLNQQKPLNLAQFKQLAKTSSLAQLNDVSVSFSAKFNDSHIILRDNQFFKGQVGFDVWQLIEAEQQYFLVNLGWIKANKYRQQLPDIKAITGTQQIIAHLRVPEAAMQLAEQNYQQISWPLVVQQIELEPLAKVLNKPINPVVLYLAQNSDFGYQKQWLPIVMPPEKHRAYAFQWLALAIAWLVLMSWAGYKNNKGRTDDVTTNTI